ncbi:hypothetical protein ID866_11451 [Astraeus odoratus]|nr:hypothetical protein ID866_11451 [Astraeus odoratus]
MPSVSIPPYNLSNFPALVDSGSTHCFVDKAFAYKNNISVYSILPIQLQLFDGTSNFIITQAAELPVWFPTSGNVTSMTFYLALLGSDCKIILGYNWLTNPGPMPSDPASDVPGCTPLKAPPILLINTAAFVHACKLEGSFQFSLQLCPPTSSTSAQAASASDVPDLSSILLEYHEFTDVFSKAKASILLPHHEHDLKIDLEEGTTPPLRTIYSLSPIELEALYMFIDENLSMDFICPTSSSHATPVLFIQKKDGSLHLCVDYHGLNKLTKKDCYLLPLISDLLDSPSHAKIYTKINLQHVYHLVQIALGDEWKTMFQMHC